MPIEPSDFGYPSPRGPARSDYINKLIAKGCSKRKAEAVAWRKFR